MRLLLHIAVLCSMVFVGCTTDKHTAALIRHAEDIAIEHPDSALRILRPIHNRDIDSKELQARHSLALSYALDKCYIDVDKDTLIRVAYDYYDRSRDTHAIMMSNYLMGKIHINAFEYNHALLYFLNAEEYAKQENDNLYLGLIYRYVSDIYGKVYSHKEALIYGEKSVEYFKAHGDKLYIDWSLIDLGRLYHNAKDYNKSITTYKDFLNSIDCYNHPLLYTEALRNLATSYFAVDSLSHCVASYQRVLTLDSTVMQGEDYAILGLAYAKIGELAKVKNVISKVDNEGEKQFLQYRINKFNKDYEGALYALEEALELQNDVVRTISTQDISSIGVEYFRYQDALKTQQLRYNKSLTFILIVVIVLSVLALLLYLRFRKVKQDRDIANYVSIINELQQSIKDVNLASEEKFVELHLNDFITINEMCEILYTYGDTSQLSTKLTNGVYNCIELIRSNKEYLDKLEKIVNHNHDNIFIALRNNSPKLNEKELRFVLYVILGFSYRSISILIGVDTAAISRLKYKIKTKLKESNNEYLSNKIFIGKL